jgi:hypothetical protein
MTDQKSTADAAVENDAKGEGNYAAAREYQDAQKKFAADKAKVAKWAYEAADAVDGPEAADLEKARVEAANR